MAGGGAVVETGLGVVVEASINCNRLITSLHLMIYEILPDSPVALVVTVTFPVTTARNPLLVQMLLEVNLTVMVVAVTGAGMEVPENVWVEERTRTLTVSPLHLVTGSVLNATNVSVTGSPVVDSSVHF